MIEPQNRPGFTLFTTILNDLQKGIPIKELVKSVVRNENKPDTTDATTNVIGSIHCSVEEEGRVYNMYVHKPIISKGDDPRLFPSIRILRITGTEGQAKLIGYARRMEIDYIFVFSVFLPGSPKSSEIVPDIEIFFADDEKPTVRTRAFKAYEANEHNFHQTKFEDALKAYLLDKANELKSLTVKPLKSDVKESREIKKKESFWKITKGVGREYSAELFLDDDDSFARSRYGQKILSFLNRVTKPIFWLQNEFPAIVQKWARTLEDKINKGKEWPVEEKNIK